MMPQGDEQAFLRVVLWSLYLSIVLTILIGLFYLFVYLNIHAFCCSEVEYIKYIYIHVMVLSKVLAAESL
jgi:hypothetical protein